MQIPESLRFRLTNDKINVINAQTGDYIYSDRYSNSSDGFKFLCELEKPANTNLLQRVVYIVAKYNINTNTVRIFKMDVNEYKKCPDKSKIFEYLNLPNDNIKEFDIYLGDLVELKLDENDYTRLHLLPSHLAVPIIDKYKDLYIPYNAYVRNEILRQSYFQMSSNLLYISLKNKSANFDEQLNFYDIFHAQLTKLEGGGQTPQNQPWRETLRQKRRKDSAPSSKEIIVANFNAYDLDMR